MNDEEIVQLGKLLRKAADSDQVRFFLDTRLSCPRLSLSKESSSIDIVLEGQDPPCVEIYLDKLDG